MHIKKKEIKKIKKIVKLIAEQELKTYSINNTDVKPLTNLENLYNITKKEYQLKKENQDITPIIFIRNIKNIQTVLYFH